HAIDDVTPGDDIVEGFEGVAGNLVLVVLHHVRLADAPELATTVVQLGCDDGPAVFINIEATLAIDVALTGLEVGLDFPDPMQLVASQVLIHVARLDDVAVLDVAGADLVAVVGNVQLFLAHEGPVVTIRGATEHVEVGGGAHAVGRGARAIVGHLRCAAYATLTGVIYPRLARLLNLIERVMHQQHVAGQAGWRGYAWLEEQQDVLGAFGIEVRHETGIGGLILEMHQVVAAIGLRSSLDDISAAVLAPVASDVVPDYFQPVLGNREGVVTAVGEIGQAVATGHQFGFLRAGLGRLVHLVRQGRGAMGRENPDLVGFRIAL